MRHSVEKLFKAIVNNSDNIQQLAGELMEHNAPVASEILQDIQSKNNFDPIIFYAIKNKNSIALQTCLMILDSVDLVNKTSQSPIGYALSLQRFDFALEIVGSHAFKNKPFYPQLQADCKMAESHQQQRLFEQLKHFEEKQKRSMTLFELIGKDDVEGIKQIMAQSVDVNYEKTVGLTLLMHVILEEKSVEILQILLEAGASLTKNNSVGKNSIHVAVELGLWDHVLVMVKAVKYADDKAYFDKLLLIAAESNQAGIVEVLLKKGVSPSTCASDGPGCYPAHWAIQHQNGHMLYMLVNYSADLSSKDCNGMTPIVLAAMKDHWDFVDVMMDCDGVEKYKTDYSQALYIAAERSNYKVVAQLLKKGVTTEFIDEAGMSAWHLVIDRNDHRLFDCFLENGASLTIKDKSGKTPIQFAATQEKWKWVMAMAKSREDEKDGAHFGSALLSAASADQTEVVLRLLLSKASHTWHFTDTGNHAVHFAITHDNLDMLQLFLAHKLDFTVKNKAGQTPIVLAAAEKKWHLVKRIAAHLTQEADKTDLGRVLLLAAKANQLELVQLLLKKNASTKCVDENGINVLHWAIENDQYEMFDALVQGGADVTVKNKDGLTPIVLAATKKKWKLVHAMAQSVTDKTDNADYGRVLILTLNADELDLAELLIKQGASLKSMDENGKTALHMVIARDQQEIFDLLLQSGADLTIQDNDGKTPIHLAAIQKKWKMVIAMAQSTQDASDKAHFGSALLRAATENQTAVVKQLLMSKALFTWHSSDNEYFSTHWAIHHNNAEMLKILLHHNVDITQKNKLTQTPIVMAAMNGQWNLVSVIADYATDQADKAEYAKALRIAVAEKQLDIVKILVKQDASVDNVDDQQNNLLHLAVSNCDIRMIVYLLEQGVQFDQKNQAEKTPVDLALETKNNDLLRCFLKRALIKNHADTVTSILTVNKDLIRDINLSKIRSYAVLSKMLSYTIELDDGRKCLASLLERLTLFNEGKVPVQDQLTGQLYQSLTVNCERALVQLNTKPGLPEAAIFYRIQHLQKRFKGIFQDRCMKQIDYVFLAHLIEGISRNCNKHYCVDLNKMQIWLTQLKFKIRRRHPKILESKKITIQNQVENFPLTLEDVNQLSKILNNVEMYHLNPELKPLCIDQCTNYQIMQFRDWLKNQLARFSYDNPMVQMFVGDIHKINTIFRHQMTYDFIRQLVSTFKKDYHVQHNTTKEKMFRLFSNPYPQDIQQLVALADKKHGPIIQSDLYQLIRFIQNKFSSCAIQKDCFHNPQESLNRIYFTLLWMIGRIDGFEPETLLLNYPRDYWTRVGLNEIPLYDIPFEDLFVSKMGYMDGREPALYDKRTLMHVYEEREGQIVRHFREDHTESEHPKFNEKQMQELLLDASDEAHFAPLVSKLHQKEVKLRHHDAQYVLETDDPLLIFLHEFGEACWQNSTDSDNTFSQSKAFQLQKSFCEFMETVPSWKRQLLETTDIYVDSRHGRCTLNTLFSEMTYSGCSGQLGKAIKQYVEGYREKFANLTNYYESTETKYSKHLRFIEKHSKPKQTKYAVPKACDSNSSAQAFMPHQ